MHSYLLAVWDLNLLIEFAMFHNKEYGIFLTVVTVTAVQYGGFILTGVSICTQLKMAKGSKYMLITPSFVCLK